MNKEIYDKDLQNEEFDEVFDERLEEKLDGKLDEMLDEMLDDDETIDNETMGDVVASKPDYEQEIIDIIRSGQPTEVISDLLENYHESDIGEVLPDLTVPERRLLYRILDISMLADIFEHIDEDEALIYVDEMNPKKAAALISAMEPDQAWDILSMISKEKCITLFQLMDADSIKDLHMVSSFSEDVIGSKMTTNCIIIEKNLSVKEAMRELIHQAADNDNISKLFVNDENGYFYGAIDLHKLIVARTDTNLEELIATSFPYVYASETIDNCIEELKEYSEDSIPVLDQQNRILGVITLQNLIDVVDDEMGEDYARFAGLTEEEDLTESLPDSIRKRLPWLAILLLLGLVVSSVVSAFEQVVSQLTIIMAFQSLILDMSGNVGTQSLAVTIRALTNERLEAKQKMGLVLKEMRVGMCNGILLGSMAFIVVVAFLVAVKGRELIFACAVSGCIGVSLIIAMLVSGAVGTLIPIFFKGINVDPAVASGPLITTVNDLVAVVTYYGMSWVLLIQILGLAFS